MSELDVSADGQRLLNVKEIQVGAGSTVFKVNKEGLFLGADNYTDAPFKISFAGVMVFSQDSGKIKIDGVNKRIIVNDGTNDRVLIGYYSGLF
jgi:hypothetical protein